MSTTDIETPQRESAPPPGPRRSGVGAAARALALRLHFYAGVFVGPFILIAAITGALYAISPTLESIVSRDLLHVDSSGPAQPISAQVDAAIATRPDLALVAVAPAPESGDTTRVIFNDPTLGDSERHAVFVDPATATPVGESVVYGSSGALPMRTWIDRLHRDLHLGEPGRLYSELAASWLWVIALAGLLLWIRRVRARRNRNSAGWLLRPDRSGNGRGRTLNWHGAVGFWILPVILLLSATGMTWSTYAGENITALRENLSWTTPAVSTTLPGSDAPATHAGGDHHHGGSAAMPIGDTGDRVAQLDRVVEAARAAGIDQPVEIAIPADDSTAFSIKERRMPGTYSVDAVAVDGATGSITARLPYADWPLMAKLSNWGIQFHMGLMFGLINQVLLLAVMIGLITVIVRGYLLWWRRRPTRDDGTFAVGKPPQRGWLRRSPLVLIVPLVAVTVLIGWFAPLIGVSLLGFLVVDVVIGFVRNRATA
ncbi:PepSY domain-containing protein [Nocardia cyriacigeorgica]|uniref:PepSY domain-containing protein n=1 Tax=Nocardia cyriacigeorgica TaxID=135487 RepID=A0ABX0CN85_9NOCA|nr:PepSY domain-containing protein [Nocardia cyriacigeorgica]NEW41004.1 PepSY domain-containing protein [Nocardia cyriacigeorgica]NEW55262.1 PepSY domain-containing protein [Nocardia cyriacigeorgica]